MREKKEGVRGIREVRRAKGGVDGKSEIKREGRERRMTNTGGSNRECYEKRNEKQRRQLY